MVVAWVCHQVSWFQTSLPLATLPLRHVITACCFMVTAVGSHATGFITERHHSRVELKSTVCEPPWQGYRVIGMMLLAA